MRLHPVMISAGAYSSRRRPQMRDARGDDVSTAYASYARTSGRSAPYAAYSSMNASGKIMLSKSPAVCSAKAAKGFYREEWNGALDRLSNRVHQPILVLSKLAGTARFDHP